MTNHQSPESSSGDQPSSIDAPSAGDRREQQAEQLLRAIVDGTAAVTGAAFFSSLVQHLARALGVHRVYVAECLDDDHARARAVWMGADFATPFVYNVTNTPCMKVTRGETCLYANHVQQYFPQNGFLPTMNAQSYLGIPLWSSSHRVIGHMVLVDNKPMSEDPLWISVLQTFAARAGAELEREQATEKLRAALAEVERLKNQLQAENTYLQEEIRREHNFHEMVGNSPALLEALRKVERVAATDSTVLILGETGSGKELFARAIHSRSKRGHRPLVKVNCGAIAPGLVESELFGHVKGAFTGAIDKRVGRFELADGGTIFLDEIGELPLDAQVKLLRVLQEQEFEPVGSSRTVKVDVRIIAATNRNLEEAVRSGRFRADLLYRLNVFPIHVPPLRERGSDVALLVSFFSDQLARKLGKRISGFSARSMERLLNYSWPGNVRELQNLIERAAILAQGPILELDVLDDELTLPQSTPAATAFSVAARRPDSLHDVQREHIVDVLKSTKGVIEGRRGAATILGMHPNTLRSRMKKLGISATSLRSS